MKQVLAKRYEGHLSAADAAAFQVGDVEIFPASGVVRGPAGECHLDPKVMEVLLTLAAARGSVVSRETLMSEVWGDIIVTDFALSRCIYQLRRNLGQISSEKTSPIKTLPKRGYRLTWESVKPDSGWEATKSRPRKIWPVILALVFTIVAVTVWKNSTPLEKRADRPAIAVMPFTNMTPDISFQYFGDGIAQTLLTELGHFKEIDVIARSSSFGLRDADMTSREVASVLDVDFLVEGSVSREPGAVRVSAALIDARQGLQVLSRSFQRPVEQSFAVQTELAREIAGFLELSLDNSLGRGGTDNYEAFEAYLRAIEEDDLEVAELFIDEALAHDGNFANALVAKASFAYERLWQGNGTEEGVWNQVRPLLEKALSISDELPYAHVLIAGFQMQRKRFDEAERSLNRALEINPSHDEAYAHLSRLMAKTGRIQDAIVLAERNIRLDPLNSSRHEDLANRLWTSGDIDAARASFERALELDPLNHKAWRVYAHRLGDLESPLAAFELVARLQRSPQFREQFFGPIPKIPPAAVEVFGLWFGFMHDFDREREMLLLQARMADSARLHREIAWTLIGDSDLDGARREAWIGIRGLSRGPIVNFQVAYIALRSGQGMNDVLDQYRAQWPGLFRDTPDLESVPRMIVIGAALINRELGNERRAEQLLERLRDEGDDPFATRAMALAHLGESGQAIKVLTRHIEDGGYFDYLPGDPFWAPLAQDTRFTAIVEKKGIEAARHRSRVAAMIASGDLVLPGQQEYHASMVNEVRN